MYESGQQRAMATELARNGGNIARAVEALRRDFEFMSEISDDTLRRNLEKPEFQTLINAARDNAVRARPRYFAERFRKTPAKVPQSTAKP